MENLKGSYRYVVDFVYAGKSYSQEIYSSVKITSESDANLAWSIADDAIKERLASVKDRPQGIHAHGIVVKGEFGSIVLKK